VKTKALFLKKLDVDSSIDWARKVLPTRALIFDTLYLLGISIDPTKYAYADGFKRFLAENGVTLELATEKVEQT
jgi:hypothetical protein